MGWKYWSKIPRILVIFKKIQDFYHCEIWFAILQKKFWKFYKGNFENFTKKIWKFYKGNFGNFTKGISEISEISKFYKGNLKIFLKFVYSISIIEIIISFHFNKF